jgi:hypothetical protein
MIISSQGIVALIAVAALGMAFIECRKMFGWVGALIAVVVIVVVGLALAQLTHLL